MASEEMNSIVTSPTPPMRRSIRRYTWSVIPAMGARTRGGSIRRVPSTSIGLIILPAPPGLGVGRIKSVRLGGGWNVVHGHCGTARGFRPLDSRPAVRPVVPDPFGGPRLPALPVLRLLDKGGHVGGDVEPDRGPVGDGARGRAAHVLDLPAHGFRTPVPQALGAARLSAPGADPDPRDHRVRVRVHPAPDVLLPLGLPPRHAPGAVHLGDLPHA